MALTGPAGMIRRWRRFVLGLGAAIAFAPTAAVLLYAFVDPPLTPLMLIRMAEGEGREQTWRPLARISPDLRFAVIAGEDNFFCVHHGFDVKALATQVEAWQAGQYARGASTITMQTAKNLLLWPGRDYVRKAIEAWLTPQIELLWSKRRILEVYLNIIETGPGLYGAEAAAQAYFGKPAKDLTRHEGALLAALLPAPRERSALSPGPATRRQAERIARRIPTLGPLLDCAR